MSSVDVSEILELIEGYFDELDERFELLMNDEAASPEDVQNALDNGDSIRSLVFRLPDDYNLDYFDELDWTFNWLEIIIDQKDGKEYNISSDIEVESNSDLYEYSENDDFDDVINKIWDEMKKEGYPLGASYEGMELSGNHSDFAGEIFETIEYALSRAPGAVDRIFEAISAMEVFYSRVIEHYEGESE